MEVSRNQPDKVELDKFKYDYQKELLMELYDFSGIARQLGHCRKLYNENAGSLHEGLMLAIRADDVSCYTDLLTVSDKFKPQLDKMLELLPDAENNQQLQERMMKAAGYYTEKISSGILNILEDITVESDNKSVKKSVVKALEKVKTEVLIKQACFEQCRQGFIVKSFLDARAKASIEKPQKKKQEKKQKGQKEAVNEFVSKTISHPELFELLKKWRMSKAEEFGQPAFFVLHQKCLIQIVEQLPSTLQKLRKIKGIGKKKVESFGDEIVEIIERYCEENDIKRD